MAVKLAHAMSAHVVLFTTSPNDVKYRFVIDMQSLKQAA